MNRTKLDSHETKMTDLTTALYQQMDDAKKLDKSIRKNLKILGYGDV